MGCSCGEKCRRELTCEVHHGRAGGYHRTLELLGKLADRTGTVHPAVNTHLAISNVLHDLQRLATIRARHRGNELIFGAIRCLRSLSRGCHSISPSISDTYAFVVALGRSKRRDRTSMPCTSGPKSSKQKHLYIPQDAPCAQEDSQDQATPEHCPHSVRNKVAVEDSL